MHTHLLKKFLIMILVVTILGGITFPSSANAQLAGAGGVAGGFVACQLASLMGSFGSVVDGLGTSNNEQPVRDSVVRKDQDFQKAKACTLDGLVWALAGDILQSMTTDVVNWINGGFDGEPKFVTNPGQFFANQANDIASEFLSTSGPLSALCGSFGADINLALRMNQSNLLPKKKYNCTIQSVMNSALNAGVNVSVTSSANGSTLGDIMNGGVLNNPNNANVNGNSLNRAGAVVEDSFTTEGGWMGFLNMTTNPQNTPIGSYLMARDDMQSTIAANREQTNLDLNRGNGFLSWSKCSIDPETMDKECEVQTPGSVIEGALQKQMGAGVDRLNAAHSINEIVGALFTQLVKKVSETGLLSMSASASGQSSSRISQLSTQTSQTNAARTTATLQEMYTSIDQYMKPTIDFEYFKKQTAEILKGGQSTVSTVASQCLSNAYANPTAQSSLNELLNMGINPIVSEAVYAAGDASERLAVLKELQSAIQANNVSLATNLYGKVVANDYLISITELQEANAAMSTASQTVTTWTTQATTYGSQCAVSTTN